MVSSLSVVGRCIKYLLFFLLALVFSAICALLLFEQTVPRSLLQRATEKLSGTNYLVSAESASFRFAHGVTVRNLRVLDRKQPTAKPIISAKIADFELRLREFPWDPKSLLKKVTLTELVYSRLPEGYYIPDSIEYPGQPDFKETNEPVSLDIPDLQPFAVTLIRPDVLGITPKYVKVDSIDLNDGSMKVDGIHLQWADSDVLMTLDGETELDLGAQLVRGEVHGLARPDNITPMLKAIDITNALPFIASFSHIEKPVDSVCKFDVNLRNNDLHLFLDLSPHGGRHNGVPLKETHGNLDIRVFVRDTYQNAHIVIGPLDVKLADGTTMDGTLVYENTNDVGFVDFDVRSTTSLSNALAIADVLNDGTLDCLSFQVPPRISLKGRLAVDPKYAAANNDLHGTLAFEKGSFFSIPLQDAESKFHVKGTDVVFQQASARGPHGGTVEGDAYLRIPDFKQDDATYSVNIRGDGLPLNDLADLFSFDIGDRHGFVTGNLSLSGPLQTNGIDRLNGHGHLVCKDGHLAQMKLFAGLTDFLSRHVPGVSSLVNQSQASLDFTISNGVFRTSNLQINGDVLSIQASGQYDMVKDDIDFAAQLKLVRRESLFGKVVSWPFSNLTGIFVDFKIKGTLEKPTWSYNKNILDRLK